MKTSRCRSCDAEVYWLEHVKTGRRAPIDADPSPEGNVIPSLGDGQYRIATPGDAGEPKHLNHFVTCPNRGDWRK